MGRLFPSPSTRRERVLPPKRRTLVHARDVRRPIPPLLSGRRHEQRETAAGLPGGVGPGREGSGWGSQASISITARTAKRPRVDADVLQATVPGREPGMQRRLLLQGWAGAVGL